MKTEQLQSLIQEKSKSVHGILNEAEKVVVGQSQMMNRLIMAFLCDGHVLLEGLPGLAKTLAVKTLSTVLDLEFSRLQFTPDLLPADLIGSMIFNQKTNEFMPKKGPIFANIILADEINRSPAKVQSALLEAMAERQVTLGDQTYPLPNPFIVLATQNPIEQEGTYPLPEAQMDRFMFKVKVEYPTLSEEKSILEKMTAETQPSTSKTVLPKVLLEAKKLVNEVYVDEKIKNYILNIIFASRYPEKYRLGDIKSFIEIGGSPRATIFLLKAARANAFLQGKAFVSPDDIKEVCYDILRHRLLLTYDAEANDMTPEKIIRRILDAVEVP